MLMLLVNYSASANEESEAFTVMPVNQFAGPPVFKTLAKDPAKSFRCRLKRAHRMSLGSKSLDTGDLTAKIRLLARVSPGLPLDDLRCPWKILEPGAVAAASGFTYASPPRHP